MEPMWAELINSDYHDYLGRGRHEDRLERAGWLPAFLRRWKLPAVDGSRPLVRRRLRALRQVLRRQALKLEAGKSLSRRDLSDLNEFLGRSTVVRHLRKETGGYRLEHRPGRADLEAVVSEIAASFAELLVEGDPSRIRICQNPDCQWIIYDRSRSRTRRWCEAAGGCGNLLKVRRFRERQRKQGGADSPA